MSAFADALAFHLMAAVCRAHAALTERASRHLCRHDCHDEFEVGIAMYSGSGVQMIACRRPGCLFVAQYVVKKQRA